MQYISMRFGLLKFIGLSLLLLMLSTNEISEWKNYVENFIFILATLLAFRMIDDCWSFYLDRKNFPQRMYINPENILSFVTLTVFITAIYLGLLLIISFSAGTAIFILLLVSNILYLAFYKSKNVMNLIPLLKYPVILWCTLQLSITPDTLLFSFSTFFMMFAFDFYDDNPPKTKYFFVKTILLFITGMLIIQPWSPSDKLLIEILLLLTPMLIFLFPKFKGDKFYVLIIFPVMHIIDLII